MAGAGNDAINLRTADADRYLSVLYAPEDKRAALTTLFSFNVEIASVRERVREALPGEIRLQWWRDVISASAIDEAGGHPLALALLDAIERYELPRKAFLDYLDARIFDLYNDPMPTRTDLERYCGETASVLIQLSALIIDRKSASGVAALSGHAGCAQAITGLMRLLPIHRARRQCYVPVEILSAAGLTVDEFLEGGNEVATTRAISAMIALAREHLAEVKREASTIPSAVRSAFLPVAPVDAYCSAIEKMGARAANEIADITAFRRHWLMFRAANGKF